MTATKTHLRGVNNIPSRLGLSAGGPNPAQSANMLARLEHQKAMLEKQLQVWVKQQALTEHRLRLVQGQIGTVRATLSKPQSAPPVKRPGLKPGAVAAAAGRPKRRNDIAFTF
jgi:hypothetical protein